MLVIVGETCDLPIEDASYSVYPRARSVTSCVLGMRQKVQIKIGDEVNQRFCKQMVNSYSWDCSWNHADTIHNIGKADSIAYSYFFGFAQIKLENHVFQHNRMS